jgi:hypothetical protein
MDTCCRGRTQFWVGVPQGLIDVPIANLILPAGLFCPAEKRRAGTPAHGAVTSGISMKLAWPGAW